MIFGPVEPFAPAGGSTDAGVRSASRRVERRGGAGRGRAAGALALVLFSATALLTGTAHAEAPKRATAAPAASKDARASKDAGSTKDAAATKDAESRPASPRVERERTEKDGEKSYQFQAVEVEGRLKAPQILYFLRRVRAELRAGRLGHRSFLPELRDTRRSAALR